MTPPVWPERRLALVLRERLPAVQRALEQLRQHGIAVEVVSETPGLWLRGEASTRDLPISDLGRRIAQRLLVPVPALQPFNRKRFRRPEDPGVWYKRRPVGR